MKQVMRTWTQLIDAWGGTAVFAADLGVPYATASAMRRRNRVNSRHWTVIVARAPYAGLDGITYEFLASLQIGHDAKVANGGRRFRRASSSQTAVA